MVAWLTGWSVVGASMMVGAAHAPPRAILPRVAISLLLP